MDNIAAPTKAQSDAPAAPTQALTFRAAHQPGPGRDSHGRAGNQGKQTVQDGFILGGPAEPFNPDFRMPEFLDNYSPHWYQDGKVLLPDEEDKNDKEDDNGRDQSAGRAAIPAPTPTPTALGPLPWSRLDYRLQAIILEVLTRFYAGELFAFQTACEALHLDRHEADEFISRHMEEWNKQLSGRPLCSEFFAKGDVHMACKHMESQGIPQVAIDAMVRYQSKNTRWPLPITTDGFSLPVDQFMSATFPSPTPSQTQNSPLDQGQNPDSLINLAPKLNGVYHFALVSGTEGDPYGVRFTEIMIPPQTLVVGPRKAYTLHHGGRCSIYYPDWCQNNKSLRLSRFTLVEGRPEKVAFPPRPPEGTIHGDYAAYRDNGAQGYYAGPVPFREQTDILLEDFSGAPNNNGFAMNIVFPAQNADPSNGTPETVGVWDPASLSSRDPNPGVTLNEATSQAMPEFDPERKRQQALDAMEAENFELWKNVRAPKLRWSAETETRTVAPKDLILPKKTPTLSKDIPGISSGELAKMPMGPVMSTSASIIRKPADYEPFLTIRLPAGYWVSSPDGQPFTFDDDFGAHPTSIPCNQCDPRRMCHHVKQLHGVGGVYSFHIPVAGRYLSMPVLAASSRLPEAVFARLLLPSPLALYRDDELLPHATACGYHELRKMRRVQRRDGETSEVKVTADLVNEDGCYMILNDMAPYKTRITRGSAKVADESLSESDNASSGEEEEGEEEDDDTAAQIAALESMPHHIQNTMLEAHRVLGPYREQLEVEAEEELKGEIRAEKRERAREKAMAIKEIQEEKKRKGIQKNANASETPHKNAPNAPARNGTGHSARSSGVGIGAATGVGLGLVPFSDEMLQRQVESSSSSSSDDERTVRKKQKLADRLERIPDEDEDDKTFRTKTSGRRVTKSVKAQQQEKQTPLPKGAATRAASTTTAATSAAAALKKTQTPVPVSVKHQSTVPTPTSLPSTDSGTPLKKKRGRPRKHPLPVPVQTQQGSTPTPVNNTQSLAERSLASTANASYQIVNASHPPGALQNQGMFGALQQSAMARANPQLSMPRTLPDPAAPQALQNSAVLGVFQQWAMPRTLPESVTSGALQHRAMPAPSTEQQSTTGLSNQASAQPSENTGADSTTS